MISVIKSINKIDYQYKTNIKIENVDIEVNFNLKKKYDLFYKIILNI